MADERLRTKRELKNLFTNLARKGITDDMISILIDTLWRDRVNQRTSGFFHTGGYDAEFSFDTLTRIFSIKPFDPLVAGFEPRYTIFSWANVAIPHRIFTSHEILIPNEEGLFCVYFDKEPDPGGNQILFYKKNPTPQELEILYVSKIIISFFYWDAENNEMLYFGDDRHGSEWNPQIHWYIHTTLGAQRKSGLQFADYTIDGDGTLNSHAQFSITDGIMLHDDFEMPITGKGPELPILFKFGNYPRFLANNSYAFAKASRVFYNSGMISLEQADSGNFVLYHIFATNELFTESRKIISVMGTAQYTTLGDAYIAVEPELDGIFAYMPQQGRCYLGTVIIQTSDDYTNDAKARIVAISIEKSHPPVTIDEDSKEVLEIDYKQVLQFKSHFLITQALHGFSAGQAIRHNGTQYVLAQANNATNAQTCGIVASVIDANTFRMAVDGFTGGSWTAGTEYFLSPTIAGLVITEPGSWNIGEVRQSLGWGTDKGLKVEIDVGDEIGAATVEDGITPHIGINGNWHIGDTDTGVPAQGQDGTPGTNGADGYSPVKNVDYFDGADGADGTPGAGYGGTSTSFNTLNLGYHGFVTQTGLAYVAGLRVRISNTPEKYMEGVVTGYSGNMLSMEADRVVGINPTSSWTIGIAGDVGATGPTGSAGLPGSAGATGPGYGGTSTTSLALTTPQLAIFTTQSGMAYLPGMRVRLAYNTATNYMEGTISSYSGTTMQVNIDRVVGSGTFANWKIGIAGDVGGDGDGGGLSTVTTDKSVTGDGSVETPVELVNDVDLPGNNKYYGTNSTGIKGYNSFPAAMLVDKDFEFCVFGGVAQTETLDLYATTAYTIEKLVAECDGILTSVSIKIEATAVTGINAVSVGTLNSFTATAAKTVAPGNRVTIVIGTGYSGTPTILRGKLIIKA